MANRSCYIRTESGHLLNNAAFAIFQAFNFFFGNKKESYFEKLAESNVPPGLRTYGPS